MNPSDDRVVFVENGVLVPDCKLSPQQILINHGAGVYTTALITPEGLVVDWGLHQKRILRGIEILNGRPSQPFQSFLSSLNTQGCSLNQFFNRQVLPTVKTALAAFFEKPDSATRPSSERPLLPQAGPSSQQTKHAMLVVCISPCQAGGGDACGASSSTSDTPPSALVSATSSGFTLEAESSVNGSRGRVVPGCSAVVGGDEVAGSGDRICGADADNNPSDHGRNMLVSIAVYCKSVQPPPYGPEHAVQAAVMGRPRSLPGAKASSWVLERRQYEESKPPGASEVLLSDASGRILEGLVTNIGVISAATPPCSSTTKAALADMLETESAEKARRPVEGESAVLRVCGPQANAALPGVVQARVVEAAQRLGMRVVLEPPLAEDRHTWSEAFISNCVKRIQPLSRVFCPPGNAWGTEPWDCLLPRPAGPYTTALLRELLLIEERTHWRDL